MSVYSESFQSKLFIAISIIVLLDESATNKQLLAWLELCSSNNLSNILYWLACITSSGIIRIAKKWLSVYWLAKILISSLFTLRKNASWAGNQFSIIQFYMYLWPTQHLGFAYSLCYCRSVLDHLQHVFLIGENELKRCKSCYLKYEKVNWFHNLYGPLMSKITFILS